MAAPGLDPKTRPRPPLARRSRPLGGGVARSPAGAGVVYALPFTMLAVYRRGAAAVDETLRLCRRRRAGQGGGRGARGSGLGGGPPWRLSRSGPHRPRPDPRDPSPQATFREGGGAPVRPRSVKWTHELYSQEMVGPTANKPRREAPVWFRAY